MQASRRLSIGYLKIFLTLGLCCLLIGVIGFFLVRNHTLEAFQKELTTQNNNTIFYDIDSQPFHLIRGAEDRKYVPLSQTSRYLQKAVVAIEDGRFFQHIGFDPIRIVGATLRFIAHPSAAQGASTITQQLVKLTLLSPERTLSRKLKELMMALALETKYTKAEILEFYLNKVYLGHRNYGVENAALNYFHKNAKDLTLAESAFIAGLVKKPEGYSPFVNLKGARARQILVLRRMLTLKWITKDQFKAAINEHILIRQRRKADLKLAPYFTNEVLFSLKEHFTSREIYGGGLKVYTTLERPAQEGLERVIDDRLAKPRTFDQIGAVSLDPATGFIHALVGGADFSQSEFNRATQARRQPGSAFKPILYATALSRGVKPNDVFLDAPVQYSNNLDDAELDFYEPENFSGEYMGDITMSHALKVSNNVVSVQILKQIGTNALARTAKRFGLKIPKDKGLCLALGCAEVTLLGLTNGYSAFANNGLVQQPVFVLKVTDSAGKLLYEYKPKPAFPAISSAQAYQMNRMMQGVVQFGTGRAARIEEASGGKTGTSDNFRDAWFIGFTASRVTGFWIGNDNNTPMNHEVGGRTPARLWKAFMMSLPKSGYEKTFAIHPDFEDYRVCNVSGKLATEFCPTASWYPLRKDSAPQDDCDVHGPRGTLPFDHGAIAEPMPNDRNDESIPEVQFPEFRPLD